MPAEGGEETQVLPDSPVGLFAVTAKGVYFSRRMARTIQLLDTATGKVSTLATLDKPGSQLDRLAGRCLRRVWASGPNTQDLMLVENFR